MCITYTQAHAVSGFIFSVTRNHLNSGKFETKTSKQSGHKFSLNLRTLRFSLKPNSLRVAGPSGDSSAVCFCSFLLPRLPSSSLLTFAPPPHATPVSGCSAFSDPPRRHLESHLLSTLFGCFDFLSKYLRHMK